MRAMGMMLGMVSLLMLLIGPVQAGSAEKAGDLLSRHYYQSAIAELIGVDEALADMQSLLVMAIALQRSSEIYQQAWRHALAVEGVYLQRLGKRKRNGSRLAGLHLAENRLEAGQPRQAAELAEAFRRQQGVARKYRDIAAIVAARALWHSGRRDEAKQRLSGITGNDPEVQAELLWARYETGSGRREARARIMAIADRQRQQGGLSIRVLDRLLAIHNADGEFAYAWKELRGADIGAAVYLETLADGAELRFYSPSLARNIAVTYRLAALQFLSIVEKQGDYAVVARQLAHEIQVLSGEGDVGEAPSLAGDALPPAYVQRARIIGAARLWQSGHRQQAERQLAALAEQFANDVSALSALLGICYRVGMPCPAVAEQARSKVAQLQGDDYRQLQSALGLLLVSRGEDDQALEALEAGRDKRRRNRLDGNDPVQLLELAELYRRQGKYAEHLEIYFELGKEFPAVRGIQEAVQGIYAAEHVSAGDVKIF